MNKRIQELAEKTNAWFPDGYPSAEGGDAAWQNLVIFEKEDLQKFAELIVKECVSLMNEEKERYDNPGTHESDEYYIHMKAKAEAFESASSIIECHFGVER